MVFLYAKQQVRCIGDKYIRCRRKSIRENRRHLEKSYAENLFKIFPFKDNQLKMICF
jgi:hypothetical protein